MTYKTIFTQNKKHLIQIKNWLIEEEKKTGSGFYCNWESIEKAFEENRISILTKDNFAIGFMTFQISELIGEIVNAEIKLEYRNQGLGRLLLNDSIQFFKKKGVVVLELYCAPVSSEPIWKNLGFLNFPDFNTGDSRIRMFSPLIETLNMSESTERNEVIELWNEEPHKAERIEPIWKWIIDSNNFEKPIIHPANYNWQICWRNGDKIIEKDKIKYFRFQRIEFGNFIIIRKLQTEKH